jgi:hypothetical protein
MKPLSLNSLIRTKASRATTVSVLAILVTAASPAVSRAEPPVATNATRSATREEAPAGRKPAPARSRFRFQLEIDPKSLPEGVVVEKREVQKIFQTWIRNTGKTPLERLHLDGQGQPWGGTRLAEGKVYGYFPNGVPMAGKEHLKGWVLSEGVEWQQIIPDQEPAGIAMGRQDGSLEVPTPDSFSQEWTYGDKKWTITGRIVYSLNPQD